MAPNAPSPCTEERRPRSASTFAAESGQVLVIEDDVHADAGISLRDVLLQEGYGVCRAGTIDEALARDDWHAIAAIILDRKLPDGLAENVLPRLKQSAPEVPVVIVTAVRDDQYAIECLRRGAIDFIVRPINAEVLRSRIDRIVEHRRAEQQIRILARLSAEDPSPILRVDGSGALLYANAAGQPLVKFWRCQASQRLPAHVQAIVRSVLETGAVQEVEVECGERILSLCLAPIVDGGYVNVYGRDITALWRAKTFAESVIDTAQAIVLVLDKQGRIVRFNRYFEEISGYELDEVRGKDWFTTFLPQREQPRIRQLFRRSVDDVQVRGNVNPIVAKDGSERLISWWDKTIKDAQGNVVVLLAIGHDITELKQAEQKALQSERLAAIGQMMTGLAHESRNALQRGQACLEMLACEVADRPAALDLVARAQQAQDHLQHLYEEVRGYAAPIALVRQRCSASDVWRDAWRQLAPMLDGRQLCLREELAPGELTCDIDPFAVGQVFRNILENAVAASPQQGEIVVRAEPDDLAGRAAVRISIRDQGPGLNGEQSQRIFDPFYTTKTQGTGLGMAIARRIIEAHGGRIAVGEQANLGAEIVVTLPRGEP